MAAGGNLIERVRARWRGYIREMIGRCVIADAQTSVYKSRARVKTIDETIPDYEFWDKLRRGAAKGYSLGALFAHRVEGIFMAWVLGQGVSIALNAAGDPDDPDDPRTYTDGQLAEFIGDNHSLLMQVYRDHLGLGDQYIIVNPDGSLSVPSPDTVTVKRDPLDWRQVLSVTVETRLQGVTITDEYWPDGRMITTQQGGVTVKVERYANLIGRIPVVQVSHGRGPNETNGHSIHEQLRPLYDQYDDLIYKQLDGAKLLGNPLMAFVGLEDLTQVMNANEPVEADTYTDKDGNTATRQQLNIDQNAVLLVGRGGDAKFVAPPVGFTADTTQALKSLFLLLLDHTGIPEFIWGNELSSARASAEVQLTQWTHDIQGLQEIASGWLVELCDIWLAMRSLVDPGIVVDKLSATWAPLVAKDENLELSRIQYARGENLLSDKTTLDLLHLVDDPAKEAQAAQAEADQRRQAMFPEGDSLDFQRQLEQAEGEPAKEE